MDFRVPPMERAMLRRVFCGVESETKRYRDEQENNIARRTDDRWAQKALERRPRIGKGRISTNGMDE